MQNTDILMAYDKKPSLRKSRFGEDLSQVCVNERWPVATQVLAQLIELTVQRVENVCVVSECLTTVAKIITAGHRDL